MKKKRTDGSKKSDYKPKKICVTKTAGYKMFCLEHCPHLNEPCKGSCKEIEEYVKTHKIKK